MSDYDLIVVGGGSAGCVLATRASEDPARRVLLIEAGPDPRPVPDVVADPERQPELIRDTDLVRRYPATRPDGSRFALLSGRIMGGGSSVNNLAAVRPMAADFAAWAEAGGPGWSYESLLPVMRALESDPDFGDGPLHGASGPLRLHRPFRLADSTDPMLIALIEAAAAEGLPLCEDLNDGAPFGICASPYNVHDGRRQSTAVAWLDPARDRPNLTILADATVTRVRIDGRRVVGVDARTAHRPTPFAIDAGRVVLSAGVFHSPQLLLLSGIGPPEQLRAHGIEPLVPLAGVGAGFEDHALVWLAYAPGELGETDQIPKVRFIVRSRPDLALPDLHVFLHPIGIDADGARRMPVSVRLLEHRSTGRVSLASGDPGQLPDVEPALLEHPDDIAALVDGIALVDRLVSHPALAGRFGTRVTPRAGTDVTDHVRSTYATYHHGVGTCRMGRVDDAAAVVGGDLRVHGVEGLWVADASVLPAIPHANTNIAAIVVAEVAAALLDRVPVA